MRIHCTGTDPDRLTQLLASGRDDAGAPITTFVDDEGDWPLRCCLRDSRPGERLAIIGYSPVTWTSPYRETGPVVVHAEGCPGHDGSFPAQFEQRDQVVRAFGVDAGRANTQVYDRNVLVRAGDGLELAVRSALTDPRVREVHVHNVVSQCFSFAAAARVSGSPA